MTTHEAAAKIMEDQADAMKRIEAIVALAKIQNLASKLRLLIAEGTKEK